MKAKLLFFASTIICLSTVIISCQNQNPDSTKVAKMCVEQELRDQCPLGTAPKLEAGAASSCNQATNFGVISDGADEGRVTLDTPNVCVSEGSCLIECTIIITARGS